MFGFQSTIFVALLGLAGSGYLYVQLLDSQNQLLLSEKELTRVHQLADQREVALQQQARTIQTLTITQAIDSQKLQLLQSEMDKTNEQSQQALKQISVLRATEKSWALRDPYVTGNRASERLNTSLQRIAGKKD